MIVLRNHIVNQTISSTDSSNGIIFNIHAMTNIRVIKIAIGDEQTAAVTRGKIAKSRTPESNDGEEVAA